MMGAEEIAADMREAGIRRVEFGEDGYVRSVELADTIPAPPPDETLDAPDEAKPTGICIAKGCGKASGYRMAPEYCRAHALMEAGVAGVRLTDE